MRNPTTTAAAAAAAIGQRATHINVARVTVLGGSVRLSTTRHLTICDLTVITAPTSERAVLNVGNDNDDVRLERLHLVSDGAGVAGRGPQPSMGSVSWLVSTTPTGAASTSSGW